MPQENIKEFIIEGLLTDGGHHKQWFLEKILSQYLAHNLDQIRKELQDEGFEWEPGIAP